MPGHFQVHKILDKGELEKFEAFTREKPARTIDECHEWLLALGHVISRSAVGAWKQEFDQKDRFRIVSQAAQGLMDAAKAGGMTAISEGIATSIQQRAFELLLTGEATAEDLKTLSMASKNAVSIKLLIDELKKKQERAVAEAEKEVKAGGSAEAVVSKVREILGIG